MKPEIKKREEIQSSTSPTIGIAFGGGGARGYAHIHVIEVLDELGIKPVAISGASIGAIMGAGMASGMSGKDIRDYVISLADNRADTIRRYFMSRPSSFKKIFASEFSFAQLDAYTILDTFLPKEIVRNFADLKIPLSISTTDYYAFREKIFQNGDLFTAIAASASIPGFFRPVKLEGRYMVDGGIYNPVPFDHLIGKADIVIGIDVVGTPIGDDGKPPKAIDSMYGASQLMMQSILSHKLELSPPTIFLRPPVSKYRVQDFFKVKQILADSQTIREELKRALENTINTVN